MPFQNAKESRTAAIRELAALSPSNAPSYFTVGRRNCPKSTSIAAKSYLPGASAAAGNSHPVVTEYLRYAKSISTDLSPSVAL